jgi:D-glycerate 3-kinase
VLRKLEAHRAAHAGPGAAPALVVRSPYLPWALLSHAATAQVGISAPQGCGKTTLVGQLTELLNAEGHASASVSIDDFYVRGEQQEALAAAAPDNELLRFRGNAGTHDLALASGTLGAWRCGKRVARAYLSASGAMRRDDARC